MAAAAVEFQRAQSLLSTDRNASIDILHAIGKLLLLRWLLNRLCDFSRRSCAFNTRIMFFIAICRTVAKCVSRFHAADSL